MSKFKFLGLAILVALMPISNVNGATILGAGTGSGFLVGNDLTDLGDDGIEGAGSGTNFDAVFFASTEPGFNNLAGSEGSFNVFDNNVNGGQAKSCCGGIPIVIGADFSTTLATGDSLIRLDRITLTSSNDSTGRDPTAWTVQGSTDTTDGFDGTWEDIFSHADGPTDWTARNQTVSYSDADGDTLLSTDGFKAFRLNATASGGGSDFALGEFELFGEVYEPSANVVPEPASIAVWSLLGLCLAGYGYRRRRRNS